MKEEKSLFKVILTIKIFISTENASMNLGVIMDLSRWVSRRTVAQNLNLKSVKSKKMILENWKKMMTIMGPKLPIKSKSSKKW